jgi:hypothetical protein
MAGKGYSEEVLQEAASLKLSGLTVRQCAEQAKCAKSSMESRLKAATARGLLLDHPPAKPGFGITKIATAPNGGQYITEKPEHGEVFEMPATHWLGKMTVNRDAEGRVIQDWIRAEPDQVAREAAMRAVVEGFKSEIPRAELIRPPTHLLRADLLNQHTMTDAHFGKLSWGEETGSDYDLKIAEGMYLDWFSMSIRQSPDAATGLLAQLGDLLHYDSQRSVTPTHGHVLDSDSRLQKMIRVVIRVLKAIGRMMLDKYDRVHWIMADANHDEAGEAWLREMFASHFEDEPRLTVDRSPSSYYAYEFGLTSLFYHHGHKKKPSQVDTVFASRFREIYGRTKHSYAHLGHRHSDALLSPNLMKVEQHETLAAPDAHEANGGWPLGRSAKVITYSSRFGEVGRGTITPEMIMAETV